MGSCFVALIEPYAGEPFIQSAALLRIADNAEDARQAVAVEVKTTTGNRDLLLADGASGVIRRLTARTARFAAEYAWQSVDAQGLRTAGVMAGTLLATPGVRIHCVVPEFVATISNVDLSKVWKADKGGRGFLVHTPITSQDLGPESDLCVWDYGLGDQVRQASSVVLRRIQPGVYEISANADATIELPGSAGEIKVSDGSETPLPAVNGWIEVKLKAGSMAEAPVVVRVK